MKKTLVIILIPVLIAVAIFAAIGTVGDSNKVSVEAQTYMQYAEEQIKLGGYGSAIDYIKAAIKTEPTSARSYRLAQVYLMADNSRSYIATMEDIISAYPTEKAAYKELADYYYKHFDLSNCIKVLLEANKAGVMDQDMVEQYHDAAYRPSVVSAPFLEAHVFYTNYALVKVEDLATYVDTGMHSCIGKFENARPASSPIMAVFEEGSWFFVDASSLAYIRTEAPLEEAWSFASNLALVKRQDGYYFINTHGTDALGPYEDATCFYSGIAAVKKDGSWRLINTSGAMIGESTFQRVLINEDRFCSSGGVIFADNGSGYDMYGADGKLIKATGFEDADMFQSGNYAAAKKNGKWGFVNKAGEFVLEPQYANARSFGHNLGAVCGENGLWGYVLSDGTLVIDYQYQDAKSFSKEGYAPVKIDTGWVYIHVLG